MDIPHKILIVDDDPAAVATISKLLHNHITAGAFSEDEAMEMLATFRPDLIVLDVLMPGTSGHEMCRLIRQNAQHAGVRVIIMSGRNEIEDRLLAYKAGADDFIGKPFDGLELQAKVRILLRMTSMEAINRVLAAQVNELISINRGLEDPPAADGAARETGGSRAARLSAPAPQAPATDADERARPFTFDSLALHQVLEQDLYDKTKRLRERFSRLTDTNRRLIEANQHKNAFIARMSHELRTPLNGVIGFADLLRGEFYGDLNARQQEYADRILDNAKHLLTLIDNLLDIANIDSGQLSFHIQPIAAGEFFAAVVRMFESRAAEKNVSLTLRSELDVGVFTGDPRRYQQVMINLIDNAVKYTPARGAIAVGVTRPTRDLIRVEVKDTGGGIAEEEQEKIFEEFYQVAPPSGEITGGLGIGLALARRIVEAQGGRIGVASALNQGSVFWFTIPYTESAEEKAVTTSARSRGGKSSRPATKHKILVVEGNETNRQLVVDVLRTQEHEVSIANDGVQALAQINVCAPHLILMDLELPGMDGLTTTRRLRAMDRFKNTPIVGLTASVDANSIQRCLNAGCTDYLAKPFRPSDLLAMIDRHLRRGQ